MCIVWVVLLCYGRVTFVMAAKKRSTTNKKRKRAGHLKNPTLREYQSPMSGPARPGGFTGEYFGGTGVAGPAPPSVAKNHPAYNWGKKHQSSMKPGFTSGAPIYRTGDLSYFGKTMAEWRKAKQRRGPHWQARAE